MNTGDLTARGTSLLIGRDGPFEPEEGARLIASAVEQGDAQACAVMATLKGAGAWTEIAQVGAGVTTYNNTTGKVSSTNGGMGATSNTATLTVDTPPTITGGAALTS